MNLMGNSLARRQNVRIQLRVGLVTLLIAVTAVALILAFVSWWPIDGLYANLRNLNVANNTVWADGYSDAAFRLVHVGMMRDRVHALLGPPIDAWRFDDGTYAECWTRLSKLPYRERKLLFKDDVVIEKVAQWRE